MIDIKGIVFDCDGVLFESRQANLAYYNAVLAELGEPPVSADDPQRTQLCHTAASPDVFVGLLGEARQPEALEIAARLDYRQFIPYMSPEPGIPEVLRLLGRHFPLAVATNRGSSMPQILSHFDLEELFRTVVTSRDVSRPKPFPDMLYEAARRLNLGPDVLLFVGDSELDQAAAAAANMRFVNYRGTLGAELNIDHHEQLLEILVGASGNAD